MWLEYCEYFIPWQGSSNWKELTLSLIFALADDDLDLLASLLEESEAAEEGNSPGEDAPENEVGEPDEYDELFDAEDDASYTEEVDGEDSMIDEQKENLASLFGDVDDLLEEEETEETGPTSAPSPAKEKTNQELQGFCNSILYMFHCIYLVSRELLGREWGLLPLGLGWCPFGEYRKPLQMFLSPFLMFSGQIHKIYFPKGKSGLQ